MGTSACLCFLLSERIFLIAGVLVDLCNITVETLRTYPLAAVASVALRAAQRVSGLLQDEGPNVVQKIDEILGVAETVVRGDASETALHEHAESVYQIAAVIAARSRNAPTHRNQRATHAGAILHCTIDCLADLDHDPQAAYGCAMLAFRSCGKLNDPGLSLEVAQDLEWLRSQTSNAPNLASGGFAFGRLWRNEPPEWGSDAVAR